MEEFKVKKEEIRKVFLDDLPRYTEGAYKGKIEWKRSIGYKIRFIYIDIEGEVEIISYNTKGQRLKIKYNDKIVEISTNHLQRCKLGNILNKISKDFKININTIFKDDKRNIIIIDRKIETITRNDNTKENKKWYKYRCNICGFDCGEHYKDGIYREEHWITEGDLKRGHGCSCCCMNPRVTVKNINNIPITAPWMVKFFVNPDESKKYTKSSNQKIKVKCPDCGCVKDNEMIINNIYKRKGIGCICGDGFSYGHKYIHNLLIQLNVEFKDNHTFDWCKFYNPFKKKDTTGEYDFVVENMKLIIEVDGDFHRKDNIMSGQKKEESEFLDREKEKLAKEHGYKEVIRISDEDDIKNNIINSKLNELFDLKDINWNKCEEFALSNRVKEACEIKRDNPDMSTGDIGKIMNLTSNTISSYFKKGSKIWDWCKYDPKEELIKGARKLGKNAKQVEIFKNNISLGVFESGTELERLSKELFGVKLEQTCISSICIGKRKSHKGFTFKYVS